MLLRDASSVIAASVFTVRSKSGLLEHEKLDKKNGCGLVRRRLVTCGRAKAAHAGANSRQVSAGLAKMSWAISGIGLLTLGTRPRGR